MMKKKITPRTLEAIRAAIAKGLMSSPQRGVWHRVCRKRFCAFPAWRYALTSNGASVVELSTGKPLVNLPFDAALASDIYDIVAATGGAMGIFIGGKATPIILVPMTALPDAPCPAPLPARQPHCGE